MAKRIPIKIFFIGMKEIVFLFAVSAIIKPSSLRVP